MKPSTECQEELEASITIYLYAVVVSKSLTLMVILPFYMCLQKLFGLGHMNPKSEGAPRLAARFFFVTGSMEVLLALCLFTAFRVACPDQCKFTGVHSTYPISVLTVGLLWLRVGVAKFRQARFITAQGWIDYDNEAVSKSIPTVQIV
jgi:hypothetical protein